LAVSGVVDGKMVCPKKKVVQQTYHAYDAVSPSERTNKISK
jgi:hypothetical protein